MCRRARQPAAGLRGRWLAGRAAHPVLQAGTDLLAARGMAGPLPRPAHRRRPRHAVAGAAGRGVPAPVGVPGPVDGDAAPDRGGQSARTRGIRRQDHDRGRGPGGVGRSPRAAGRRAGDRRQPGRGGLAAGMGLLPRGDDLRRDQRDPEGHRVAAAARLAQERLMATDERALLAATLDQLAREHDGAELTKALEHFGFADLLAASPRAAVAALFTAMGRAGSMSAAVQDVLGQPLADLAGQPGRGGARPAVLLPAISPPLAGTLQNDVLTLRGLVVGPRPADVMLAPVSSAREIAWVRLPDRGPPARRGVAGRDPRAALTETPLTLAPVSSAGEIAWVRLPDPGPPARRAVAGLDPALALTEITLTLACARDQDVAARPAAEVVLAGEEAARRWHAVAVAGRRALGYQIVGAVSQMIELAVGHARDRVQFGRPVG